MNPDQNPESTTPTEPTPSQDPATPSPESTPETAEQPSVEPTPSAEPVAPLPESPEQTPTPAETVDSSVTPPAPAASAEPAAPNGEDPGRTLGIVGFVLAFLAALVGLILSVIALNKSKKAGFKNNFALAGLIISIANMVIGTIIFIIVMVVTYNGVSSLANATAACANQGNVGTVIVDSVTYTCGDSN